jgi:hypothetical protein
MDLLRLWLLSQNLAIVKHTSNFEIPLYIFGMSKTTPTGLSSSAKGVVTVYSKIKIEHFDN